MFQTQKIKIKIKIKIKSGSGKRNRCNRVFNVFGYFLLLWWQWYVLYLYLCNMNLVDHEDQYLRVSIDNVVGMGFKNFSNLFLSGLLFVWVISVMSVWTRMQPDYAANMWNEALNKRLGTEVCLGH